MKLWNSNMGLQCTLANFRLVGRIGRQEFLARDEVVNGCRDVVVIGSGPKETGVARGAGIFRCQGTQLTDHSHLGQGGCGVGIVFPLGQRTAGGIGSKSFSGWLIPTSASICWRSSGRIGTKPLTASLPDEGLVFGGGHQAGWPLGSG